ncbi:hypothetical protein C0995_001467 [Termitomyces sp. Mi166|nr:hypothetical protein C0995_001467 [Termitomyces sp. Mi166\
MPTPPLTSGSPPLDPLRLREALGSATSLPRANELCVRGLAGPWLSFPLKLLSPFGSSPLPSPPPSVPADAHSL